MHVICHGNSAVSLPPLGTAPNERYELAHFKVGHLLCWHCQREDLTSLGIVSKLRWCSVCRIMDILAQINVCFPRTQLQRGC